MTVYKRSICLLLCCVMTLLTLSVGVSAADTVPPVSLTATYAHDGTALADVKVSVYQVAHADAQLQFSVVDAFDVYEEWLFSDEVDAQDLAATLEGYVLIEDIAPTATAVTNTSGCVVFDSLEAGVYLVAGERYKHGNTVYTAAPLLVSLPSYHAAERYVYDVEIEPKIETVNLEENPTVKRKVLKVWQDAGYEHFRPETVTVVLFRDGEKYDEVRLNRQNDWRYTWEGLDPACKWTISEKWSVFYLPLGSWQGITFVLNNYYIKKGGGENEEDKPDGLPDGDTPSTIPHATTTVTSPDQTVTTSATTATESTVSTASTVPTTVEKLPQTGQLWWPVPILAASGLACVAIGMILRGGYRREE